MAVIPSWENTEIYKAVLIFDNDEMYTAFSKNNENDVLASLKVNERQAITSGNPVGILSPNSCNLIIYNNEDSLIPTNSSSPYYGYMRNGVRVELYMSQDEGLTWLPYGIYYTEGWNVTKVNGMYEAANLTCTDMLSYIGNMDIPKLRAYAGVNVVDLLKEIFRAIGLTEASFYIDPSLSLNLVYAITKGNKLREVLNTIAQSLIARITINRAGVIEVLPAFPSVEIFGTLNHKELESLQIKHNQVSVFNRVKLNYNKLDDRPSEVLLELNNITIRPGLNKFNNLELSKNVLAIDGAYLETDADTVSYLDKVQYINYTGSQGGVDIEVFSNMEENFLATLSVEGRSTGVTNAFVESVVKSTDPKVANTLSLESFVIQEESEAQQYVNAVANYLYSMEQEITINGKLSPILTTGMYINIESGESTVDGNYLITRFDLVAGESYSTNLTLVKIRG